MSELNKNKVLELQGEFLKRLETPVDVEEVIVPQLLKIILDYDDEVVDLALGEVGKKVKLFAEEVDFSHPDLKNVFDKLFDDKNSLLYSSQCIEALALAKIARDNNFVHVKNKLENLVVTLPGKISKKINSAKNNKLNIRFLKDEKTREEVRLTKKMQTIKLDSLYKKGEDSWSAQPDGFNRFLRFNTAYQDDLKIAERKAETYDRLGCKVLAAEIRKDIDFFKEHLEQNYFGFNRITITTTAIILAKSLQYTFCKEQNLAGFAVTKIDAKIVVDRKFFGNHTFDPNLTLEFSPYISDVAKTPIFTSKQSPSFFLYEPRVYPLHEFMDIASEETKAVISNLDAFPEAAGKPLFDNFSLVVPGVMFPNSKSEVYSFVDEKGLTQVYSSKEEATRMFDKSLVKGKFFYPVILGEKDGKCYFLTYFS